MNEEKLRQRQAWTDVQNLLNTQCLQMLGLIKLLSINSVLVNG